MLSRRSLTQKSTHCTIPFMLVLEQAKRFHGRKKSEQCLLPAGKSRDKMKRYERTFWADSNSLHLQRGVTQMFAFIKTYSQDLGIHQI